MDTKLVKLLERSVTEFNTEVTKRRAADPNWRPDLAGADLSGVDLSGADLSGAVLTRVNLSRAHLWRAGLSGADLSGAGLSGAGLSGADLSRTATESVVITGANFSGARGLPEPLKKRILAELAASLGD
jgi:uncharacterized protein YjbI with pentapeptide repeats